MGEYPEDIQKVAENIVANWLLTPSAEPYVIAISAALMAERERALKIVAEIVAESGMTHEHDGEGAIVENVCDDIANAIRNQSEN